MSSKMASDFDKEVFLRCCTTFAGQNAQIRKPKAIQRVLLSKPILQPLLNKYGLERVSGVARNLLVETIFQSPSRARERFPELYQTTTTQSARREASEHEAAQSEAEALVVAASASDLSDEFSTDNEMDRESEADDKIGERGKSEQSATAMPCKNGRKEHFPSNDDDVVRGICSYNLSEGFIQSLILNVADHATENRAPTLFPVYLPYNSQHHLLGTVQIHLEHVCYTFAEQWLPQILQAKKWNCAEAGELNVWAKLFLKNQTSIPKEAIDTPSGELDKDLVAGPIQLRHAAVHRLPTTIAGMQKLVRSAANFARTLKNNTAAAKIERIYCELERVAKSLEGNKELLESKLDRELRAIDEERASLVKKEKDVIATMIPDDHRYQTAMGPQLNQLVTDIMAMRSDRQPGQGGSIAEDVSMPSEKQIEPDQGDVNVDPRGREEDDDSDDEASIAGIAAVVA